MSDEQRRPTNVLTLLTAGAVIGAVEVVLACSFAALVFGSYLVNNLADGIGLYLFAAALTLAVIAWRAGPRGVVGSVQDAAAAVLAVLAGTTALATFGGSQRAFLSVVAATLVVTVLTGVTFLLLGVFKLGNLFRFVPYPVVAGFLAGTGWLLAKGGVGVAASTSPTLQALGQLFRSYQLEHWVPALAFGLILVGLTRIVKRPLVLPVALAAGFALFAIGMLVARFSVHEALAGGWMLGPFPGAGYSLFQPWTLRALSGADWSAVLKQAGGIATTIFVAVIACLFNVSGIELMLSTDLDPNRELRDVGLVNIVSGPFGGIPGYHALILTSLAKRLNASARAAGLIAAAVPLAAVLLGTGLIEVIPRVIVGGVLVFIGVSFILEWVVDLRRSLPVGEFLIVLAILAVVIARGLLPGVEAGLVLALILFAVNYSRIELVREAEFGATYRSNVDRSPAERGELRGLGDRVQILRVNGFVFFGTASGLLERVRRRVEVGPLAFLVVDLRRVTGMDSSAVLSFRKMAQLAEANAFEVVFAGASERVRAQLARGSVAAVDAGVSFAPDLDHALERVEDRLLAGRASTVDGDGSTSGPLAVPARLGPFLERRALDAGAVLVRQGDPPDDVFVLESGRLTVELRTSDGARMRLRSMRPGVVVGEIALYTDMPRTADVVAEEPSVVLRISRDAIGRMESNDPELAAALHRWLATTLAERLNDTLRAYDALLE